MPDDDIAGFSRNGYRTKRFEILLTRIGTGRKTLDPGFDPMMEPWNASKRSLLRLRVREVDEPLDTERDRQIEADIPMKPRARKLMTGALGWIETNAVGRGPEIGCSPDLRKDGFQPVRLSKQIESWMMEELNHDPVIS